MLIKFAALWLGFFFFFFFFFINKQALASFQLFIIIFCYNMLKSVA